MTETPQGLNKQNHEPKVKVDSVVMYGLFRKIGLVNMVTEDNNHALVDDCKWHDLHYMIKYCKLIPVSKLKVLKY
jgi:hypothetical protein